MLKLSELADDVKVTTPWEPVHTVAELKKRIWDLVPNISNQTWYVVGKQKWKPDVEKMIKEYLRNESRRNWGGEGDDDWEIEALMCFTEEYTKPIQILLENALSQGSAMNFTVYEEEVELDI